MALTAKFGLERGIHAKDGITVVDNSMFIDDVVEACKPNNFLAVRGFSNSEYFDPKVVLVGFQYDDTIVQSEGDASYFTTRVRSLITRLARKKSVIVSHGAEGTSKDKAQFKPTALLYPFFDTHDVRYVDSDNIVEGANLLKKQGIAVDDATMEQRVRDLFIPGIMKAVQDANIAGRVFVAMHINQFVPQSEIIKALEKQGISYLLLCPDRLFLSRNVNSPYTYSELQTLYKMQLKHVAGMQLN